MRTLEAQELEREAFRQRIMREASIAFAHAAAEGRTMRRPAAPVCATCEGRGWIDDPAHPIGGSYEDFLAAGPTPWIDCPDCAPRRAQAPASATIGADTGMYVSEPIPGRESVFYAAGRYYANAEDARRARLDLTAQGRCPRCGGLLAEGARCETCGSLAGGDR